MAALRSRCDIIFSFCVSFFFFLLFSSPNLSGRRVDVYHSYLIATIVMTFRVSGSLKVIHILQGLSSAIFVFWHVSWSSASAELLVLDVVTVVVLVSVVHSVEMSTAPSSRNHSQLSSVTYLLLQLHRRRRPLAVSPNQLALQKATYGRCLRFVSMLKTMF